jgi:hypothetical protein
MARLLEGKIAAITGGVTGIFTEVLNPDIDNTYTSLQELAVLSFSSILDKVLASASTISLTTSQDRNSRVWLQKQEMPATKLLAYLETLESRNQGKI